MRPGADRFEIASQEPLFGVHTGPADSLEFIRCGAGRVAISRHHDRGERAQPIIVVLNGLSALR